MKKIAIFSVLLATFALSVDAGPAQQRRGQSAPAATPAASTGAPVTAARAAVRGSAPTAAPAAAAPTANAARAAAPRVTAARSGTTPTAAPAGAPVTAARAATSQKVINTGTKVATAATNTVVDEACRNKYEGCMDSFCMLDNTSGGRCLCSDRKTELDKVLSEIEKLDAQSYKMATEGVERLEIGADADIAMAMANAEIKRIMDTTEATPATARRRSLDLSLWDTISFDDVDDIFGVESGKNPLEGKEGDALHRAVAQMCVAQMPECAKDLTMLQSIYSQSVRADCTAYENELKRQRTASASKLAAAEKALRETALEAHRSANKWDAGQCATEFKRCMVTTAGCGDDFTGCVEASVTSNSNTSVTRGSSVMVSKLTMEMVNSKRVMCEHVTNSCVSVKDSVWDIFLREVAPALKTAELLAEDKLRTDCIGNISACFQKGCRDTMDPKDPDGSYDMCLTRPETIEHVCKVQIDKCPMGGAGGTNMVMDFVKARLAAMRVDACTNEVKSCLVDDNRCGPDYANCVGMDTFRIVQMCPHDRLLACQQKYGSGGGTNIIGEEVFNEIERIAQGILLNIDNSMLSACQKAADAAMIKICGGTDDCNQMTVDKNIGAKVLTYQICNGTAADAQCVNDVSQVPITVDIQRTFYTGETTGINVRQSSTAAGWGGVVKGALDFDNVEISDKEGSFGQLVGKDGKALSPEFLTLQTAINNTIRAIESDQTVDACIKGRTVQGIGDRAAVATRNATATGAGTIARTPNLTRELRTTIAMHALNAVRESYDAKYAELQKQSAKDYVALGERIAEANAEATVAEKEETRKNDGTAACEALHKPSDGNWEKKYSVTATYSAATGVCHKCVVSGRCNKKKALCVGSNCPKCKPGHWSEEPEVCEDIQF